MGKMGGTHWEPDGNRKDGWHTLGAILLVASSRAIKAPPAKQKNPWKIGVLMVRDG